MRSVHRHPAGLPAVAGLGAVILVLPIIGLVLRVPWSAADEVFSDDSTREALLLSLRTSVAATVLALLLGLPVAWMLAFGDVPARRVIRALCVLPMVLPPVVGGVILLSVFGRRGIVGQPLDDLLGWRFAFTEQGAVLAQFFVSAPFFVVVMESAFRQVDADLLGVARVLGAGPWFLMRRVTMPLVRPSVVAGLVLTWARAIGEFGATITFAGNTPGRTQTVPLAIYSSLESNADAALLLSLLLVSVSLGVLVSMRSRWLTGALGSGGA